MRLLSERSRPLEEQGKTMEVMFSKALVRIYRAPAN